LPPATPHPLSEADARRLALGAQGFGSSRPAKPDIRHIRKALDAVAIVQIDSANVFCRSHYMPAYSRIGPYDRAIMDRLAGHEPGSVDPLARGERRGELFEYWGHEASLVPVRYQPLLRWRMARAQEESWNFVARVAKEQPELLDRVLELLGERGAVRGSEASTESPARAGRPMWNWSDGKNALEYLFYAGRVSVARRIKFERLYDLTERVLPPEILASPTPSVEDAQRELITIAARCLGVATEEDLGDYFRLPRAVSRARVSELAESGDLLPVEVEGWSAPAFMPEKLASPKEIRARALVSPFDSLVWSRPRTARLFGFDYRLEIYVPAAKRNYGYYVLPFLLNEALVARVDLKSDRQAGALLVLGAFAEDRVEHSHVARELAAELHQVAGWLGLGRVNVARRGDLSRELAAAVKAHPDPAG
jgi:uncharacterized protein YcaQ